MKKIITCMSLIATVFLLGSTNVYADGYWEEFFKEKPIIGTIGCGSGEPTYLTEWKNISKEEAIVLGGCGSGPSGKFEARYGTSNLVFNNVGAITIKSSNENIVTATSKPYDFAYEKKNYEDYVTNFNKATFDEFVKNYLSIDYGCEDSDGNYIGTSACLTSIKDRGYISEEEYAKYEKKEKPTWWEFSDYKTEPTTWWEAYQFKSEPTNAVEVISYAKDLGKATLTLSAAGKQDITIDWSIEAYDFGWVTGTNAKGLAQILNDLDKYKENIPTQKDYDTKKEYNFAYYLSEKEDISEAINALKGKDITVLFKQYTNVGESIYFLNGKEIKNEVGKGFTYAHNISMDTSINKDKINNLVDAKDAIYIDFTYHGTLPTEYKLSVNIKEYIGNIIGDKLTDQYCAAFKGENDYDKLSKCWNDNNLRDEWNKQLEEYLKNTNFTLLYYNPEKNKMEVVAENLKAIDEKIELTFDHFSSYVLVPSDGYQIKINNAQTGTLNVVLYSGLAIVSLLGIGYLIISKKKND